MDALADREWIVETARGVGFELCGIARAERFPELEKFGEWLERGYAGEMKYLQDRRRAEPSMVMEDLRSVIVCGLNYNTSAAYSTDAAAIEALDDTPRGWISRYAWGDDYHEVMWKKLNALVVALKERFPEPFAARAYADTGPVAERVFAKYAGLGWLGKNTLLLNEAYGSWLFLGVIFTSLDLAPSLGLGETPPTDLCGNCRQCLDACPTEALIEPYVLDARRCISYLTIELRGSIPEELREPIGWQVYGCDICQDVCPYNRKAPVTSLGEFQPRQQGTEKSLLQPVLEWLAGMEESEFREIFRQSAMKRTKWAGLVRNACVALGNVGGRKGSAEQARIEPLLRRLAESDIPTIAESAQWALRRIQRMHA
ncbi:MAG: tRNA epoxyqueuosine(34) reductase QueG [Candidatus Acidiferrum sp.]